MQDFTGRKALIIGGTSGMGLATAARLVNAGGSVVVTGRSQKSVDDALAQLGGSGKAEGIALDLTDNTSVEGLREQLKEQYGGIDLLVNAAGVIGPAAGLMGTAPDEWDRMVDTNLRSIFLLTRAAAPELIRRKGSVVNISSVAGLRPYTGLMAYCVSKAGIDMFTQCAALDLAPHLRGYRVLATKSTVPIGTGARLRGIFPGWDVSLHWARYWNDEAHEEPDGRLRHARLLLQEGVPLGLDAPHGDGAPFCHRPDALDHLGRNLGHRDGDRFGGGDVQGDILAHGPHLRARGRGILLLTGHYGNWEAGSKVCETDLERARKMWDAQLITKQPLKMNAKNLNYFDAVAFYTTGELDMDDQQKADLLSFVRSGKGYAGSHCATDTFYKWAQYGELIGAYFDGHPWHQKIKVVVVASGGEALTALLGGHVDMVPSSVANLAAPMKDGRIRIVAVAAPRRVPGAFADIPTWKEQGIDAVTGYWRGVVGPAAMPAPQVAYWDDVFARLVKTDEWKKELDRTATENEYINSGAIGDVTIDKEIRFPLIPETNPGTCFRRVGFHVVAVEVLVGARGAPAHRLGTILVYAIVRRGAFMTVGVVDRDEKQDNIVQDAGGCFRDRDIA